MGKRLPERAIIVPVLCLLFLAFAPSALAQEDALYLGGGEFDNMHHLLELSDGNIILSLSTYIREDGKTPLPPNTVNGSLLCIGQGGKLLWQLHAGVDGEKGFYTHISADNTVNWNLTAYRDLISMGASVLPLKDGMAAIGRVLGSTGGITKLNEAGRVIWEMSLAENGVSMLDFGTIASNGDIIAVGHRMSVD